MRFTPHSFFKLGDEIHFLLLSSMQNMIWTPMYFIKMCIFWIIKLKTLCSRVDISPGLADIFCSKTDVWFVDFYPAKPQSKTMKEKNRSRCLATPRGKGLKHLVLCHWGIFLLHAVQPGCPWYHFSGEVCSLSPQKTWRVTYTNDSQEYMYIKGELMNFAALHLT